MLHTVGPTKNCTIIVLPFALNFLSCVVSIFQDVLNDRFYFPQVLHPQGGRMLAYSSMQSTEALTSQFELNSVKVSLSISIIVM